MDQVKFKSEAEILKSFIKIYCDGQEHPNQKPESFLCKYHELSYEIKISLCEECQTLLKYSLQKLQNCPCEIKPRCRTCPHPCYEKDKWKTLAKVMRFSGLKLGVLKVKQIIKSFF